MYKIEKKYNYYLYSESVTRCEIDVRYQNVDWSDIGQQDLLQANDKTEWARSLPKFVNDNKNQFHIYSRRFPQVSWECRTAKVRSLLMNDIDINSLWYYQIFLSIASITFILAIQFQRRAKNKLRQMIISQMILSAFQIGIEIWVCSVLDKEIISPIDRLCQLGCIDEYINEQLNQIKKKVKNIQFCLLLPIYIITAIFFLEIIYIICLIIKTKLVQRKLNLRQKPILQAIDIASGAIHSANYIPQQQRDVHMLQQAAENHFPNQENARSLSHLAFPLNIVNPHSIVQIRNDEESILSDNKTNTTKDTQTIKRQFF